MKKALAALWALLLLAGCGQTGPREDAGIQVLCTTYPVYLFTTAVTEGVEDVEVSLLVNSPTSCLHDYTLTVKDMKAIEGADVIVMNGAGLEDFMDDALSQSDAAVIDCSAGINLLPLLEEHNHGHEDHEHEEYDPHIWMDPRRAWYMVDAIACGLSDLDEAHAAQYSFHSALTYDALGGMAQDVDMAQLITANVTGGALSLIDVCATDKLITFHDGFQYFADAFGLDLLRAIEEEEGATASAHEIREVAELVEEYEIPAIFVEKNGSRATAEAISRETGCEIYELDMLMSGEGTGIQPYLDAMSANCQTIREALS